MRQGKRYYAGVMELVVFSVLETGVLSGVSVRVRPSAPKFKHMSKITFSQNLDPQTFLPRLTYQFEDNTSISVLLEPMAVDSSFVRTDKMDKMFFDTIQKERPQLTEEEFEEMLQLAKDFVALLRENNKNNS